MTVAESPGAQARAPSGGRNLGASARRGPQSPDKIGAYRGEKRRPPSRALGPASIQRQRGTGHVPRRPQMEQPAGKREARKPNFKKGVRKELVTLSNVTDK